MQLAAHGGCQAAAEPGVADAPLAAIACGQGKPHTGAQKDGGFGWIKAIGGGLAAGLGWRKHVEGPITGRDDPIKNSAGSGADGRTDEAL